MNIEYADPSLKELFENGKTSKGCYQKLSKAIIIKYIRQVNIMRAAHRIDDLYPIKSLQYEKNVEKLNYGESVKIDEQHRILFESTTEHTFIIKEVLRNETSKHYGN